MPLIAYHSADEMEGEECRWSAVMHLVSITVDGDGFIHVEFLLFNYFW